MNDAEDACGCIVCAALCGVCGVAAAEEDKRERERAEAINNQLKNPIIQVNPVLVSSPHSQKTERMERRSVHRTSSRAPINAGGGCGDKDGNSAYYLPASY